MTIFQCQIVDEGDDWSDIDGLDHEDAAERFAEQIDDNSGGEAFQEPGRDELRIRVRQLGDTKLSQIVVVSHDYTKVFYSRVDESEHAEAVK